MQFKAAFFTVLSIAISAAIAAPTGDKLINVERAAEVDGTLYVCTDANWAGQCANLGFFADQCQNMPSSFNDNISSFGPSSGWECTTYTDANCNGDTYSGHLPGFATLPWFINDHISSFRCEPT